jgi:predicted metalloprotease with PDZ domain
MSITRKAVLLLMLFFCNRIAAQNNTPDFSYHISLDLQNVTPDKDRVKVTVLTPPIQGTTLKYILPAYLPGIGTNVDAGRFIHLFYAIDDKGFPLKVSKKGNNMIVMKMRKGATLKKIEYWVDDTWDDEKTSAKETDAKFNYVPQPAGSNIDAGNNYVINHAFFFGYIEGYSEVQYNISILKPDDFSASSNFKVTSENKSHDSYKALSYQELIDNPVMYSRPDTASISVGNIYLNISVYSENGRVTARLVRRLLAAQLTAEGNFISEAGRKNYRMIFYFTTPFKTVLNKYGDYGGLAHKNCAFYFLPELADEDALSGELMRETSGDLLHLLQPLDYFTTIGDPDFLKPQLKKSLWFTEGTNLYFSWLAGVRDSFVNENEFMGAVSAKIKLSQIAPKKPISDLATLSICLKVPLKKEAMRARAMLTAFLLDIRITDLTKGKMDLRQAVLQLHNRPDYNSDSLETWLIKMISPELSEFFRDYVEGIKPLPLMNSFEKIGWAYAPAAIDSVLTFGQFGLLYNDNLDAFFVYNADTTNLFGLRDGDRIVSVDGMIVGSSNFDEALHSVYTPVKDERIELRFIRNDVNFRAAAIPQVKAILVEYLIRTDAAAGNDARGLHNRIFFPKAS